MRNARLTPGDMGYRAGGYMDPADERYEDLWNLRQSEDKLEEATREDPRIFIPEKPALGTIPHYHGLAQHAPIHRQNYHDTGVYLN